MKNIEKTDKNYNDLLKELEGICKVKYIRNSEIAKVFDMGQATIDDFDTFNEETISYVRVKNIIEYCESTYKYMSEAEFRANFDKDKFCDDIREVIKTFKNNIRMIAKQTGISPSFLSHIKNGQYKGVPQRLNFRKTCKGFNLKESDYVEALQYPILESDDSELKEKEEETNNKIESALDSIENRINVLYETRNIKKESIISEEQLNSDIIDNINVELKDSDELIKDDLIIGSTCFIFDSSCIGKETYHKLLVLLESLDTMTIGNVDFDLEINIKMK